MSVIKCNKCGRYYERERHRKCPYCGINDMDTDRTVMLDEDYSHSPVRNRTETCDLTIGEFSFFTGTKPVTGWLVCVEGNSRGRDYKLFSGWNRIGSSPEMQVCITDDDRISRMHGAVVYDSRSNLFHAVSEAGNLIYINGETLEDSRIITSGDTIEIGSSKFVFIAFCEEGRTW